MKTYQKLLKYLDVSRATIRKATYSPLEDKSRKPKTCPRKLSSELENLIIEESKRTGMKIQTSFTLFIQKI